MLFDLAVLGNDPAGLAAARLAAEAGQRVAVVDDPENFGRTESLVPDRTGIRHFSGSTRFQTDQSLEIAFSGKTQSLRARRYLLACGDRPKRPAQIPFDGQRILDSDEARGRDDLPGTRLIVGAGKHGLACAADLLRRGGRVSLVDQCRSIDSKASAPEQARFWETIREARCPVHWGTTVLGVENRNSAVTVFYDDGAIESYAGVVFAVGRLGCTDRLDLPCRDLLVDESCRVWCNEWGQTNVPHIYAAGAVVGFPRFAGTPAEEARHILPALLAEAIPPKPAFLRKDRVPGRR